MELDDRADFDKIWGAFMAYDQDGTGQISVMDLKKAIEEAGEKLTDDECYWLIAVNDPENRGSLQFSQFKSIIIEKRENERGTSQEDLLDAFVAMGGEPDGDGAINAEKLIATIKNEFEMTIDIEKLI